jgi:hypothetical protein
MGCVNYGRFDARNFGSVDCPLDGKAVAVIFRKLMSPYRIHF